MGKKAPDPTPPQETSAAQTGANVNTAIANSYMGNITENTPDGSTSVRKTGEHTWTDEYTGQTYTVPTWTRTTTLSPEQQAIKEQQNRASLNLATLGADQSARVGDLLSRPVDTSTLPARGDANSIRQTNLRRVGDGPALQTRFRNVGQVQRQIGDAGAITRTYGTDFSQDRQRVEDALMDRMNPGLEQDRKRLESRLASQGIRIGSEAYNAAMDDYSRQTNDARLGAILNAGQEQSRLTELEAARAGFENAAQAQAFGQNEARAQFANTAQAQDFSQAAERANFQNQTLQQMHQNRTQGISMDNQSSVQEANADAVRFKAANDARNQALQEIFALRNQPINEIIGLMSGSQVQSPQFMGANIPTIPTTDNAGIIANYDQQRMNAARINNAAVQDLFGGFFGLGSDLIKKSDRRVKTDVKKVGKTYDGQPIYQFRYKSGGPIQMGLMAQDVEKTKPKAVTEVDGIKMVDYGIALGGRAK